MQAYIYIIPPFLVTKKLGNLTKELKLRAVRPSYKTLIIFIPPLKHYFTIIKSPLEQQYV
jgi:hypothetical protein